MTLVLRNGSVILSSGPAELDIVVTGEQISELVPRGQGVDNAADVDHSGHLLFPGFIDPHVHSRDPGSTHKEDFEHSTKAAAIGGITTILEMPNSIPPVTNAEELLAHASYYRPLASVDYGLWGLSLGVANRDSIGEMFKVGAVGIKLFWGYYLDARTFQLVYNPTRGDTSMIPPSDAGQVMGVAEEVAAVNGVLALHCEDRSIVAALESRSSGILSYQDLLSARPELGEAVAVAIAAELARITTCHIHVVHLSSSRGVQLISRAQSDGAQMSAETCPHYLTLDDESPPVAGGRVKVYPPIRTRSHQEHLWEAVRSGVISSVGSDHAPHSREEQRLPLADRPAGMTGVETLGPVMIDAMCRGLISSARLAAVLSTGTAMNYGLYPRKGALMPGSDADVTVVDPGGTTLVDDRRLHSKNPASPWHGVTLRGRIVQTYLRGQLLMSDGEIVGNRNGEFVAADHTGVASASPP